MEPDVSSISCRRWFQIHLSTAIIFVLLVGVALGLNCTANPPFQLANVSLKSDPAPDYYGWPFGCMYRSILPNKTNNPDLEGKVGRGPLEIHWPLGLALNIGSIAFLLVGAVVVSEWRIRRRRIKT